MTFVPAKKRYKFNPFYPNSKARWIDDKTGLRRNYDGTLDRPEFMKIRKAGRYTKKEKQVIAKSMYEAGWGSKRLSEWFKVSPVTITKWVKIPTPEALQEFECNFKAAMLDYDMESTWNIKNRINQLIPQEDDIIKLVKAGEFFSGEKDKRVNQTNTQVNIYGDMLKKYKEVNVSNNDK